MTQKEVRECLREKVYSMRFNNIEAATGIPAKVISRFMCSDEKELWPDHLQKLEKYLEAH